MVSRLELQQFFNKDKAKEELETILSQIESCADTAEPIITYCLQWFQSYFEGHCQEADFLEEIVKLEQKECEDKLMDFIKKQIEELNAAVKESKKTTTSNVGSSIADRIKPKANVTHSTDGSSSQSQGTKNQTVPATKKQVKIQEKDETKMQKAAEGLDASNDDDNLLKELENKKKQRCKYFPNCKNMDTCPFVHPTEPCKFFPKCKYGAQCLNKHPDCKFGKNCQRMDCFYEHPFPKKQGMNPLLQMMMMSMPGAPKRKIMGKPAFKKPFNAEDDKSEDKDQQQQASQEQQ